MDNEGNTRFTFPGKTKESEAIMVLFGYNGLEKARNCVYPYNLNFQILERKNFSQQKSKLSVGRLQ